MKVIILEDTNKYKSGEILEVDKADNDLYINNNFISKNNYITEDLTEKDLIKVKELIDKKFKLFFWRLYTKSKIVLQ